MRYKEFNKNKVLEECIPLFWGNSFNGTPISNVVEQTNVNRFSLYHEFQNKQGILYEALKLYKERYSSKLVKTLDAKLVATDDIRELLTNLFCSFIIKSEGQRGCFIIYIATELGDNDPIINDFLRDYLHELEAKFLALLIRSDEFSGSHQVIAKNLVMFFCNSMCYCHIQSDQQSRDFVSLNLDIILNN
ncbi:MAG: AcrR family transcriptional regulator [Saprospiraceae bacterium]|jgi:AcrR family transcriptional regulator